MNKNSTVLSYPNGFPGINLPYDLVDKRIFTAIKFIVAPIAIFLHVTVNYIFFFSKNKQKYTNTFYKLVFTISCLDIYGSSWRIYTAFCYIFGGIVFGETWNILMTSGFQYIFFLCMNMDLLIAFNRFSAVVLCKYHQNVFSDRMGYFYIAGFVLASAVECIPTFYYGKKWVGARILLNTPEG